MEKHAQKEKTCHRSCCCDGGNHTHNGTTRSVIRIAITALLLVTAIWVEHLDKLNKGQLLLIYLMPYLLIGWDTLKEAIEGLVKGDYFNENFLMTIATIGALCIGFLPGAETEYPEAVFVMLFFKIGECFEEYAEGNAQRSISHLMEIRPDIAHVKRNGQVLNVEPQNVTVGETVIVKPGEKIPLDGIVKKGTSSLNMVALTGESIPHHVKKDDDVVSGCINLTGVIEVQATKTFGESTVSKIIQMVESADDRKSKSEAFITRFARVYTPIVVLTALMIAFIPPLWCSGMYMHVFPQWLYRALIFLVVSCPCALVISVPLTFFGGIGGASKKGILVKGSNYMESLSHVSTMVFDKTGTLTSGHFEMTAVHTDQFDKQQLLHLASHAEHFSMHPIGLALQNAYPNESTDGCHIQNVQEWPGEGIQAYVNGHEVCVGNTKLMNRIHAMWHDCHSSGTIVHVAIDGTYAGHFVVNDVIKPTSVGAIAQLKSLGINKTVMLTGDRKEIGEEVSKQLGIDECYSELMPIDKVLYIEKLLKDSKKGQTLAFVGDGINDAPSLKRADIGIAMGALGSDAAIEAADVVLMDDNPMKLATAVRIARRTVRIGKENILFAIGVKISVLALAVCGWGNMWLAVMADVGVTVLAVLNAMRTLKNK